MFPNAKFIYLMRNPYTVFESTRSFFTNTIQPLKLEEFSNEAIEQNILTTYRKLHDQYEADKHLIPEGNLIEVKFEDFEADALGMTEEIYRTLSLPGWDNAKTAIAQYVGSKRGIKRTSTNTPTAHASLWRTTGAMCSTSGGTEFDALMCKCADVHICTFVHL